ncbi:MAG TPA: type-F conjugative transfer system secretin TraK [Alphaproteobacteria bacterium]|nr:type-F conjugative transfer system secretin TraK [Alphaproteobacteria bacterium]
MRKHVAFASSLTALSLQILGKSCFALQTYPLVDQQSTQILISQTEQNRIAVVGDRIQQVFGGEGSFDVQSDEEGGQIFLRLSSGSSFGENQSFSSKPITITMITESGLTQDLKLISKPIESQSILFKPHSLPLEEHNQVPSQLQIITTLMKEVVRGGSLKGYIKSRLTQPDRILSKDLKLELLALYKGEAFEARIYTLENQGNCPILLKEQNLALQRDVALHLSKGTLRPQEKTKLYIISRQRRTS